MYARDQKAGEEQRKAAATGNRVPSTATAGTHTPDALRMLQRSAGNAAASRVIGQQRHAHGPGCGHHGQASGSSAGLPVQRVTPGPHMKSYKRPNISNAATEEMLSYQGVADRPSSPRAQQRNKDLAGDNSWDVALKTNWDNGKVTGTTPGPNPIGISRNHRLSDYYVGHILEKAAQSLASAGQNGPQALKIRTAVEKFATACAPSAKVAGIMTAFDAFAGGNGNFRDLVAATSNNGRNLRAGHANDNSSIHQHFDPGIIADGKSMPELSPISDSIDKAVRNLVTEKVIPQALADEALQLHRGYTSSDIRQRA
ncbi:hypothetical protein [Streptomyces sp. NPDC017890]|uniref:hypothetical protein n=1 Tax=Streptomyces sp. NPDC017890 TaxID=3365015 RepID=UPI0037AA2287